MPSWDNCVLLMNGAATLLQSLVAIVSMVKERKQR